MNANAEDIDVETEGGEVVEVGDEAVPKQREERLSNEAAADEQRAATPDDQLSEEEKREKRRRERQEKREKRRVAMTRDKTELNFLRQRNEALERRLNAVEARTLGAEVIGIDGQLSQVEAQLRTADEIRKEALDNNEGANAIEAEKIANELRKRRDALVNARNQRMQEARRPPPQPNVQAPPPFAVLAQQTFSKMKWFDPQARDEDSAIVYAVDTALTNEGSLDPNDPAYWSELTRRLKKRLPHRFAKGQPGPGDDDDDDDDDQDDDMDDEVVSSTPARQQPRGGGPRVPTSGTAANGKYFISAERKQAMIDAGAWDDPVLRKKYIKRYMEWDRQNSAGRKN